MWGDEELDEEDWEDDDVDYEEDYDEEVEQEDTVVSSTGAFDGMEPDDGMSWEGTAVEEERARAASSSVATAPTAVSISTSLSDIPNTLKPGAIQQPVAPIAISTQSSTQPSTQPTQQKGLTTALRQQTSSEILFPENSVAQGSPASPSSPGIAGSPGSASSTTRTLLDPAAAGETRKILATPSIAREAARQSLLAQQLAQQEESVKCAREEAHAAEESARKKGKIKETSQPVSSLAVGRVASNDSGRGPSASGSAKLRKGRDSPALDEDGGKKEKKRSGVFALFGRKRDKNKDKHPENVESNRDSEDSGRSGSNHGHYISSPPETAGPGSMKGSTSSPQSRNRSISDPRRANAGSTPTPGQAPSLQAATPVVSQHSLKMQQIDQQQQALYQQYLKSSPASAPEGPSYGLQSAASIMPISNNNLSAGFRSQGGRPGSLILAPNGLDGQGVPELSVIRVFAGPNLHTEATFKTVLLNASTTSSDLIRQAMQRFRLAAGEDEADYYLEIKQVEGQSAVLLPHEKPLGVFEGLVEVAQLEVPKVKRSSVGSISSVSSQLSMHPAIKKLSMNDFTDDSAVKFYLNRRSSTDVNVDDDDENTIIISVDEYDETSQASPIKPSLTVTPANGTNVTPERFSSPSARFALQVCILPEDLPDGMIFDPHTEAIVPKNSLRDRSLSNAAASSGVSQTQRRKVLPFPKNTTVAEVIELALERFGIAEGVVDGGDEIEDKLAKRISLARVRYGLAVQMDGLGGLKLPSHFCLLMFFPVFCRTAAPAFE